MVKQLLFLLLSVIFSLPGRASINVKTDQSAISFNDTFTLTITRQGTGRGEPQFSVLQQYVDIIKQHKSNSIRIINGIRTHKTLWTLTLAPKITGLLEIPAIKIGNEQSQPIRIQVNTFQQSQQQEDIIFIQIHQHPKKALYVQQKLVLTLQLYYRVVLTEGKLADLHVPSALVEKLGDDISYDTKISHHHYHVIERRYAVFAQKSGTLTIPAVIFQGEIADNASSSNHKTVLRRSKPLTVTVLPKPAQIKSQYYWLPGKKLQLQESWSKNPATIQTGTAITRTLRIQVQDILATQLPDIPQHAPKAFKVYPEKPVIHTQIKGQNIITSKEIKSVWIATQTGTYTLPAISVHWWDTQLAQEKVSQLPAKTITVTASDNDLITNNSVPASPHPHSISADKKALFWKISAFLLFIFALIGIIILQSKHRPTAINTTLNKTLKQQQHTYAQQQQLFQKACQVEDLQACKDSLLLWAKYHWPSQRFQHLDDIAHVAKDIPLADAISKLDARLYSSTYDHKWHTRELWNAIQHYQPAPDQAMQQTDTLLAARNPTLS